MSPIRERRTLVHITMNYARLAVLTLLVPSMLILPGCKKLSGSDTSVVALSAAGSSGLETCAAELDALQDLNGGAPDGYRQRFDALMAEASRYSGIRDGVGSDTQDTVDALYRYRVNRLCAEIHHGLLSSLAERGEQAK